MQYILIVIVLASGGSNVSMQEFNTLSACEEADRFISQSLRDQFLRKGVDVNAISARCVPKGDLSPKIPSE